MNLKSSLNGHEGFKKYDTITSDNQEYHSFIRPLEALDGKTPSEACGIIIEGGNKWKTLIQNASKKEANLILFFGCSLSDKILLVAVLALRKMAELSTLETLGLMRLALKLGLD